MKCPKCGKEMRYPLSHVCSFFDLARAFIAAFDALEAHRAGCYEVPEFMTEKELVEDERLHIAMMKAREALK